jgi:hypothetical protein
MERKGFDIHIARVERIQEDTVDISKEEDSTSAILEMDSV